MFSVRLYIAVAGLLLMSDTNQAKSAKPQSASTANAKRTAYLKAAMKENENAIKLLAEALKPESLGGVNFGLRLAQGELDKLLKNTTINRLITLAEAFSFEFFGYFKQNECKNDNKCNKTYGHIQRATGKMMAEALTEVTDKTKKNELKTIIGGNITKKGGIPQGVSLQQTKEVAEKVRDFLFNIQ